ncbi:MULTISPECIES: FAD:protein FMN transferase [unclassified Sphingomonas]|uniref:FAD:protein FMN transferase n=1 Tax=unclassified Sphingomonas TaxID=196159 RepID=UPI0006F5889C|nr:MULTISPECIES: FAD:protein FMN transferase [unclassified Sphingomonas]KQX20012.1 thiamine biosynthesis protein ApbE [Sphingomonas sp. Root1294]KQY67261.1 thiamine biosynthesis protein ApbE [Sphingomonas sp. Root50]KRB90635.1 thiamine biosynthesis protein ApbE [Sphingomonas sp. Root720]
MGTGWSVRFAAPSGCDPARVEAAILARLDTIIVEMSHWRPDSLISAFNRGEPASWHDLPADFAEVIAASLHVAERSGGVFDPTIGQLVDLAGFGPDPRQRDASDASLAHARQTTGWQRLRLLDGRLLQPGGLALDLSGIAKGHAVDAVADALGALGIAHALVEIGGELAGRGVRPDGDPWWVDLENPPDIPLPRLRIALHGIAVATSGDYRRGAHSIDPRTGRSTANGVRSVSVIHRSAMLADAWATALTVAGPEAGLALAARERIAARIVGDREWLSPALVEMLEY